MENRGESPDFLSVSLRFEVLRQCLQALEGCVDMLIKKNWTAISRIQEICWLGHVGSED